MFCLGRLAKRKFRSSKRETYIRSIVKGIKNYKNSTMFDLRHNFMCDFLGDVAQKKWKIFLPNYVSRILLMFSFEECSWEDAQNIVDENDLFWTKCVKKMK